MTFLLMIELAAKSAIIAGAALAVLALIRRRSAAERSWVAHAALVVLLFLPLASLALPRWRLLPTREAEASGGGVVAAAPFIDPTLWLQGLYTVGAALLLLGTGLAIGRLFTLRRGARVVLEAEWLTALARAQQRMGFKSGAALLVSGEIVSPISWGMLRPTIVLNETVVSQTGDAEAIIAHELAHVVRLDWAKLLIARLVTALYWFNPLVWILARQCHQLREEAADDAVLRADVPNTSYATLLIEAARHECRASLIAAHGVAPGEGSLQARVRRVLDQAARRTPTAGGWALGALVGAALFAGPLAAVTLEQAEPAPATQIEQAQKSPPPPRVVTVRGERPVRKTASGAPVTTSQSFAPSSKAAPSAPSMTFRGDPERDRALTVATNVGRKRKTAEGEETATTVSLTRAEPDRTTEKRVGKAQRDVARAVAIAGAKTTVIEQSATGFHSVQVNGDKAQVRTTAPTGSLTYRPKAAPGEASANSPPPPP